MLVEVTLKLLLLFLSIMDTGGAGGGFGGSFAGSGPGGGGFAVSGGGPVGGGFGGFFGSGPGGNGFTFTGGSPGAVASASVGPEGKQQTAASTRRFQKCFDVFFEPHNKCQWRTENRSTGN
nr:unnamed protein product [Callosobruchus analis]